MIWRIGLKTRARRRAWWTDRARQERYEEALLCVLLVVAAVGIVAAVLRVAT